MYSYYKIRRSIYKGYFPEIIRRRLNRLYLKLFHSNIYKYYRLISVGNYKKAFEIGEKELVERKDNVYLIKKNASLAYHQIGNHQYAEVLMRKALALLLKSDINKLIQLSRLNFPINSGYKSGFKYFGGTFNFGFICHVESRIDTLPKYITKILDSSGKGNSNNKEIYFYQNICKANPQLRMISPNFLYSTENIDFKYSLLTIEMLEGRNPIKKDISKVLEVIKITETISYKDSIPLIRIIDLGINTQRYAAKEIHSKIMNKHIFSEIKYLLNKAKENNIELLEIIMNLEKIIISKKLYKNIIPEIHYCFCHNDFYKRNIILDDISGRICIIDWDTYDFGLRGWDMNNYFADFEFSFDEILKLYIDKCDFCEGNNLIIAKIFFVYMQIYKWVLRLKGAKSEDKLVKYFRPASFYIEELYNEYLKASENLSK